MKMKHQNRGKIYPSPPSSSSSSSSSSHSRGVDNSLSVLNLLPSAIFTLVSLLSLQEKQALAYMLTRSLNPPTKKTKLAPHKPPLFDCDCFDCYTSYWYDWDTSPNREIIHHAIEAFEEQREQKQRRRERRGRRREKAALLPEKVESFEVATPESDVAVAGDDDDVAVPARKGLPDVVGMIGSRLWSLWNPSFINN